MATPKNASAIASASAAKASAAASAAAAKTAATTAAANTRSAAIAPTVQNVIGNINTGIGALSALVSAKKPTATQQATLDQAQAATQAAIAAQVPVVTQATTGYNTALDVINTNYSTAMASANAIAIPEPDYGTDITADMNALQQLQSLYSGMGLGPDIATALTNLIKEGYTADTLKLMAQDPNAISSSDPYVKQFATAYNTRFVANADRIKNGFAPLAPADYIARESAYRSAMASAGLPPEFYNTNAALSGWIANNVDTATVQAKINIASDVVNNYDQTAKDQALALYGLDTGHLIAHILDPVAALPIIQKQANIVQLGADAARAGVAQNLDTLTQLNTIGTTQSAATQAFGNIAAELPSMQAIASRYSGYGPAGTIEQSLLNQQLGTTSPDETQAQAEARLSRLKTQESSTFGGSSGASAQGQSLGVANQQGVQ